MNEQLGLVLVAEHAELDSPGFGDRARSFVTAYLARHGRASGEVLTNACKAAGIRPFDDRAFGSVFKTLARRNVIVKVDSCQRHKGNNTAGGNVWALR